MEFKDLFVPVLTVVVTCGLTYYFTMRSMRFKQEMVYKQRAAKISELFACWIKYSKRQFAEMSDRERSEYYERLNRLTWELVIWIPDDKVVKAIMDRLSYKTNQNIKQLILSTRNTLHNRRHGELQWEDIVHWAVEDDERRRKENANYGDYYSQYYPSNNTDTVR